jgi:Predicted nucleotidyltransferase
MIFSSINCYFYCIIVLQKGIKNMQTCGIISEYNPFHNGHAYQIQKAREMSGAECMIAVMSGNFVQRGEPAIIDKWKRAEAAVRNGIDVVIELPYFYATQSASQFAAGGVNVLKHADVDGICFGSECGNLENLQEIADTPVNPDHLHEALDAGMSYPKAYSLLTSNMYPNDLLAVSYLRAIKDTNIKPYLLQRTSGYLDETMQANASAMAIRKALKEKAPLQNSTPMEDVLQNSVLVYPEMYYSYLRTFLLTSGRERLEEFFLFSEGIENHLVKNAKQFGHYEDFLKACTNYRYTASRIRRSCLQAMNQVTKTEVQKLPPYDCLRVLAFNDTGRKWLAEQRKKETRIAAKFADVPYPWRQLEYRTTLLYTSVLPEEERSRILALEIQGAHYIK